MVDFSEKNATPVWTFHDEAPTQGEFDLRDRNALKRINGLSTELDDVTEVEYRALRIEKVVLVGVWSSRARTEAERSMVELAQLAKTAGAVVLDAVIQYRDKPDPATYIGSGKAGELAGIISALGVDTLICDGELTGAQLSALEKAVRVKVIDRTVLILDIFAQHATSREGKAQVSLAQMQYMLPRLRGWGDSLSRQAGGVGLRGPGETKIETDRRRIRDGIAKLKRDILEMKKSRAVTRLSRNKAVTPRIAIAGYTNAGKSSLLNAVTRAGVLVQDALFATLDPVSRRATIPPGVEVIFADTVGFVNHLPAQLIEAFAATLDEIFEADVLIHVVDASDATPSRHISAVREIISEVALSRERQTPPEIIVFNKCDELSDADILVLRSSYPESVCISATTGVGIPELYTALYLKIQKLFEEVTVLVPYNKNSWVEYIHSHGIIRSQHHSDEGTLLVALLPVDKARKLRSEFSH